MKKENRENKLLVYNKVSSRSSARVHIGRKVVQFKLNLLLLTLYGGIVVCLLLYICTYDSPQGFMDPCCYYVGTYHFCVFFYREKKLICYDKMGKRKAVTFLSPKYMEGGSEVKYYIHHEPFRRSVTTTLNR